VLSSPLRGEDKGEGERSNIKKQDSSKLLDFIFLLIFIATKRDKTRKFKMDDFCSSRIHLILCYLRKFWLNPNYALESKRIPLLAGLGLTPT
jgi:hypothetical protein